MAWPQSPVVIRLEKLCKEYLMGVLGEIYPKEYAELSGTLVAGLSRLCMLMAGAKKVSPSAEPPRSL
jgi:predicted ABC-type exoprotein transport system permease subunit